jgi:hypothetical protein
MNRAMASSPAERPQRGFMRVVVLEPSEENRNVLTRELDQLEGFALVGQSSNGDECLVLLRALVPELLIAPTSFAFRNSMEVTGDVAFPVFVGLGSRECFPPNDCVFETVNIPLDPNAVRTAMERARTEIYRRKLDELSVLLRRYMEYSRGLHRVLTAVHLEDGRTSDIPAEQVMFMAADGNYIRLHTGSDVHEIRETMSGMTSKLDPAQFARVHRSFIVNRAHVTTVLRKDGAVTSVLLTNGTEIPVGPNYRSEVDGFEHYSLLSA